MLGKILQFEMINPENTKNVLLKYFKCTLIDIHISLIAKKKLYIFEKTREITNSVKIL